MSAIIDSPLINVYYSKSCKEAFEQYQGKRFDCVLVDNDLLNYDVESFRLINELFHSSYFRLG